MQETWGQGQRGWVPPCKCPQGAYLRHLEMIWGDDLGPLGCSLRLGILWWQRPELDAGIPATPRPHRGPLIHRLPWSGESSATQLAGGLGLTRPGLCVAASATSAGSAAQAPSPFL